ncbi:hypothetical protein O3P69_015734 [Scylla paramamosain]|uniref:Cilia- and flagella-associated protein 418 n=1 Tax=Scylla paramamosain TaxID=85552 RepID=A0AAW0T9R2_SCYPA
MADDIDELLDEVEDSLSHDSNTSSPNMMVSESVKTDDLKDLLDDIDEQPHTDLPEHPSSQSIDGRCNSPLLAGISVPPGISTGVTQRACDRLRCLKCDMMVVTIDGFCWSDTIDYLFLRNNYPDMDRLCARLEPQRVGRAYACQCQHCSLTEPTNLACLEGIQWVCGGHSLDDETDDNPDA